MTADWLDTAHPENSMSIAAKETGFDELVVCSLESWDEVWRRNQFLVRELLALRPNLRILFVEPALDVLHSIGHGRLPKIEPSVRQVGTSDRLWALRPVKVLPRVAGPWADHSLEAQIIGAASRLKFVSPVLWVNDSSYAGLLARTRWPALYDVTDDWLSAPCTPREHLRRRRREDVMLASSAEVVVCSPSLQRSREAVRSVRLIPNGVDVENFRRPRPRPSDLPLGKIVLYVGTLHESRLDVDLCTRLAKELGSSATLVLVGPDALSGGSRSLLTSEPNIELLGSRPYASVPAYMTHADVVIVPHLVNAFTESLDPIKAYEVMAAGRPAVATPVAGFRNLGKPVTVVEPTDFVHAVRNVLVDPRQTAPPPSGLVSWADRAGEFLDALDSAARQRGKKRVLYLDHCALPSGAEIALARLLPHLSSFQPSVLLAQQGPLVDTLRESDIPVQVLPMKESVRSLRRSEVVPGASILRSVCGAIQYVLSLSEMMRRLSPDLVATNSLKAALYGGAAGRIARRPVVWHLRNRVADDYLPGPAVAFVKMAARVLPSGVIANSRTTLKTLALPKDGRPEIRAVIGDPCPFVRCNEERHTSRSGRDEVSHHSTAGLVYGMVCRLQEWKGQDLFLRAFARAFPSSSEKALIVGGALFGEESYREQLRDLVKDLGLEGRVRLTGHVDDVLPLLESMNVLVHASVIPEPFGQVVLEGMACGLPVIAPDAGGPMEVITDGVDGLLFRMGDEQELSARLLALAQSTELRENIGRAATVTASLYDPNRIACSVEHVYQALLS